MDSSRSQNRQMLERLATGLEETSKVTRTLLSEVRDSEADFFIVKSELNTLRDNIKTLIGLIQDGEGDIAFVTKLTSLETKVENAYSWINAQGTAQDRLSGDILNLNKEIDEIAKKVILLERDVSSYKIKVKREERIDETVKKEKAITAIKKKHDNWKINKEFIQAVVLALLTFIAGYFSGK